MQTAIISLKDRTNELVLNIDEEFWVLVRFVAFHSQLLEIKMKNGTLHRFLHYWAYEAIQNNNNTEELRQEFFESEGCGSLFFATNFKAKKINLSSVLFSSNIK